MKKYLFFTFLLIFLATAAITLGGITGLIPIDKGYLDKLFITLIVEVIGSVIALFKAIFSRIVMV